MSGDDIGQPNPLITQYIINIEPLATSKPILFDELWGRLDSLTLLNAKSVCGKSQAARDV